MLVLLFAFWYYSKNPLITKVSIRDQIFLVDVAVTPLEKQRGLGGRDRLAEKHGMLFPYDHKEIFPFWMRGMRFPIDIIWIADKTVVDITHNAPVASDPENTAILPTYKPKTPVDTILEINAGEAVKYGIQIGDAVRIFQ